MEFARVLHIGTTAIGSASNSGLTLEALFGGWPEQQLMQLVVGNPGVESKRGIVLAPPSVAPLDAVVRGIVGRSVSPPADDGLNRSVSRAGQKTPMRLRLRLSASALNDIGPTRLPGPLRDQLLAFRPTVVHSLLGSVRQMRLVHAVSSLLDVPVVPHFMDDWIDTLYADGQLLGLGRNMVDRSLRAILDRSEVCLAVGDEMAREYSQRFQRKVLTAGNCVDLEAYRSLRPARVAPPAPRRLRYVGGLHLGRADVIRAVAKSLRPDHDGRDWVVELFVPVGDVSLARSLAAESSRIRYAGSLVPSDVPQTLVDADALVFIESSEEHILRFTRLSVSTKVPQYLASGRPVIVFGPAEQASVRVLVDSGAGYLAGDGRSADENVAALDRLSASSLLAEEWMSASQSEWIGRRFGLAESRARLREALMTVPG